jgi:putative ABC transport system ATP-binding protein
LNPPSSFSSNREVAPISEPVFKFAIDGVRPFIDLEGIRIIEVDGKPSAFFLILPDLNDVLKTLKVSFGLLDLLKMPAYRRSIRKGVVALIGSKPDSNGMGLGRILAEEMRNYACDRYDEMHTMWIDDRNPSSYVLAQNSGMAKTKSYGVFRKVLGATINNSSSSVRPLESKSMTEQFISITGLNKHYQVGDDKVTVLRDIKLVIPRGSMTVVRGMSGSGKTTLLNVIGGLDTIDAGQVVVAGVSLEKLKFKDLTRYRAEKVGFIFQFHNLIPTLTVLENVLTGLEAMRPLRSGDEDLNQAKYYLNAVGLGEFENKFPARLSGGQQQRVAIARALIKEPALILADEPTGSLDEESGQAVIDLLRRLQAEKNVTVIIVTHNPEWGQYADTVYEMRTGNLKTASIGLPMRVA